MIYLTIQEFAKVLNSQLSTIFARKRKGTLPSPDIEYCGCCDETREKWNIDTVIAYKWKLKKAQWAKELPYDKIKKMAKEGFSWREIGNEIGVKMHVIRYFCEQNGINSNIDKQARFNIFLKSQLKSKG